MGNQSIINKQNQPRLRSRPIRPVTVLKPTSLNQAIKLKQRLIKKSADIDVSQLDEIINEGTRLHQQIVELEQELDDAIKAHNSNHFPETIEPENESIPLIESTTVQSTATEQLP
jgi:hypothetical protein